MEIKGLFIDIPYWGTGAGIYLVEETLKEKRKQYDCIKLECFESSPRANAFYKKLGFKAVGKTNDTMPTRIIYELNLL